MIALANNSTPEEPDDPGGLGGNFYQHDGSTRDTRLIARAIRERWPIAELKRKPIMDRLIALATDENTPYREAIAAAKAVIDADKANQADEHLAIKVLGQQARETESIENLTSEQLKRIIVEGAFNPSGGNGTVAEAECDGASD